MVNLNLARKWRSKTFDELVGQELSVRILKNTLYLNHFFPVYLFAGQRGCGKTSTARIFAAAINCFQLSQYQENPKKQVLPCQQCDSCLAMKQGSHPDFIEMDAASNTGVDNVRQIIDAASLLPTLGTKKIYLIDEAHMLSKAAFNAFLKILEEPPTSVVFILATTDSQKIIDTVKSRSFQLFFGAVKHDALLKHLESVCQQEEIRYESDGLSLIIKETDGSVRDALNLLEQVRFSSAQVSKKAVLNLLSHCNDEILLGIAHAIADCDAQSLVELLHTHNVAAFKPEALWQAMLDLFRSLINTHYGISLERFGEYQDELQDLSEQLSIERLTEHLQLMYSNEMAFSKTRSPHMFIEMMLLGMCKQQLNVTAPHIIQKKKPIERPAILIQKPEQKPETHQFWQKCLEALKELNDPMLQSIFQSGSCYAFDAEAAKITIAFSQQFSFFKETLKESEKLWQPIIQKVAGKAVFIETLFIDDGKEVKPVMQVPIKKISKPVPAPAPQKQTYTPQKKNSYAQQRQQTSAPEHVVDVSDKEKWKLANQLLELFPGTVTEIQSEGNHG